MSVQAGYLVTREHSRPMHRMKRCALPSGMHCPRTSADHCASRCTFYKASSRCFLEYRSLRICGRNPVFAPLFILTVHRFHFSFFFQSPYHYGTGCGLSFALFLSIRGFRHGKFGSFIITLLARIGEERLRTTSMVTGALMPYGPSAGRENGGRRGG